MAWLLHVWEVGWSVGRALLLSCYFGHGWLQCAWGQAPSLAPHPTLFCLVGVWGKGWPFPCIAVLDMMDLVLVGTSWSPRRRSVNREPEWKGYISTLWEKKNCRNVILMLVLGIISPESSRSRLDDEIKSSLALWCWVTPVAWLPWWGG